MIVLALEKKSYLKSAQSCGSSVLSHSMVVLRLLVVLTTNIIMCIFYLSHIFT